jgi:hypothetical protein
MPNTPAGVLRKFPNFRPHPKDAKVTRDGKDAKLSDLKKGDKVTVTVDKKGDKNVITKIEAKSK